MGIRFYCPNCDRRLHVKEFLAGKRGICPHCDESIRIPKASTLEDDVESGEASSSRASQGGESDSSVVSPARSAAVQESGAPGDSDGSMVITESEFGTIQSKVAGGQSTSGGVANEAEVDPFETGEHLVWYVRPPSGGQYGPAEGSVMRQWLAEGRVTPDSLVWQEGWEEWRLANEVFTLGPPPAKVSQASATAVADVGGAMSLEPGGGGHNGMQDVEVDRTKVKMLEYRLNRARGKTKEMVLIGVLGIVCVVLVVLLGMVVTGRL